MLEDCDAEWQIEATIAGQMRAARVDVEIPQRHAARERLWEALTAPLEHEKKGGTSAVRRVLGF
jgi:hypothetical protein